MVMHTSGNDEIKILIAVVRAQKNTNKCGDGTMVGVSKKRSGKVTIPLTFQWSLGEQGLKRVALPSHSHHTHICPRRWNDITGFMLLRIATCVVPEHLYGRDCFSNCTHV